MINGGFCFSPKIIKRIEIFKPLGKRAFRIFARDGELYAFSIVVLQPMDTLRDKNYLEKLWRKTRLLGKFGKLMIDKDFWRGKRVFLTGHTGFKGSWISLWLNYLGAEVKGYSLDPVSSISLYDIFKIKDFINSEINDIRQKTLLAESINSFKPEIIIHMAAQPLVQDSYEFPIETYETNVMGTANILDAAITLF